MTTHSGDLLGHYRIIEQIGAGGMGIVYRARDEQLERDVAIKVLPVGALADETARKKFRTEALALARMNHSNIATIFEFGSKNNTDYLVTEYISGQTLAEKLTDGNLLEKEVVALGIQIAQGLASAHERGIVHRDLKPDNLRLTSDGRVKILDFGLAELMPHASDFGLTATLSKSHEITGTFPYMAPEQLRGEPADARTDIWAVGAVLYEMATAKRPFPDTQLPSLIESIIHNEPASPRSLNPDLTAGVEKLILRALNKKPHQRFQSANELAVSLQSLGFAAELQPKPKSHSRLTRIRWARKLLIYAAMSALLLLSTILATPKLRERWASKLFVPANLPDNKLVAVLPFETIGNDAEMSAFGDGLTETLSAKLGQFTERHPLQIIPTQELRAVGVDTAERARTEFGVNLVVEGSLHRLGSAMRVNFLLVDPATRQQLRGGTITASASDTFNLEEKVVTEVLKTLTIELEPPERLALQHHGTAQSGAYDYYLRGRGYMQDYHKQENIDAALIAFGRAIALDPNYVLAYAGLGEAYWREFQASHDSNFVAKASDVCQKAVSLAADVAQGHFCLGRIYEGTGNPERAVKELELAVVLDPSSDEAYRGLALSYSSLGRKEGAEATYRRAIALRPHYWAGYSWLGTFYFKQARYADAVSMFTRVVELSPDNFRGYSNLGAIHVVQGLYKEAIDELNKSISIRPSESAYTNLGTAYFGLRRFEDAAHAYEQGIKLDDKSWLLWGNLGDASYWAPNQKEHSHEAYQKAVLLASQELQVNSRDASALGFMATYQAMLGDKRTAMKTLDRALAIAPQDPDLEFRAALVHNHFDETEPTLKWLRKALSDNLSPITIRDVPDFDHLRADHRFKDLLKTH